MSPNDSDPFTQDSSTLVTDDVHRVLNSMDDDLFVSNRGNPGPPRYRDLREFLNSARSMPALDDVDSYGDPRCNRHPPSPSFPSTSHYPQRRQRNNSNYQNAHFNDAPVGDSYGPRDSYAAKRSFPQPGRHQNWRSSREENANPQQQQQQRRRSSSRRRQAAAVEGGGGGGGQPRTPSGLEASAAHYAGAWPPAALPCDASGKWFTLKIDMDGGFVVHDASICDPILQKPIGSWIDEELADLCLDTGPTDEPETGAAADAVAVQQQQQPSEEPTGNLSSSLPLSVECSIFSAAPSSSSGVSTLSSRLSVGCVDVPSVEPPLRRVVSAEQVDKVSLNRTIGPNSLTQQNYRSEPLDTIGVLPITEKSSASPRKNLACRCAPPQKSSTSFTFSSKRFKKRLISLISIACYFGLFYPLLSRF
nr:unnamed protein product [Spirometra erinaceieuropaei]